MQNLTHLITQYGYLAVFVLMLAESACIPVPSEVIMMFGGAMAAGAFPGEQPPSLIGVVAAGVLGNVAGSYLAWAVGKYAGRAAIGRWGRGIGVREHEIDRAVAWFERHGPVAVLVGRVIPVIRTFISLPAGFAGMPASRFGLYTALGCIPWTAALGIAGYALGANWEKVANDFHGPTYAIAGILLVAVVVLRGAPPPRQERRAGRPRCQPGAPPERPRPGCWLRRPGGTTGRRLSLAAAAVCLRPAGATAAPRRRHGTRDAYGPQVPHGQGDAYGPQDPWAQPSTPQDSWAQQSSPQDSWAQQSSPQDPWAQPSGRPNR